MKSVFVSSTFRDMHFERDVLNRRVAPKLNYQLTNYNQSVHILDLRWCVDTSDMSEHEASERVLSTCFKAIDECKPYMIVLIGDRYGYVPDGNDFSVTHLEIIRGVFENANAEHTYIYFRDSDYSDMPDDVKSMYIEQNEASRATLVALKNELQEKYPHRCRQYKAKWSNESKCLVSAEFEKMIIEDLESDLVLKNQGIRYRSDLHKQICENEEMLADSIRLAYSNADKINSDIAAIMKSDLPYGIIGDGGTGKSIYMSLLCYALRKEGQNSYILFCGDNAFSASVRNAAEMVLYILLHALGEEYQYEKYAMLSYDELISCMIDKRAFVKEKRFLFLDAVDKCDTGMINFIYWCNSFLTKQIQIVFSSRMIAELNEQKDSFTITEIEYDREDFRKMIRCILYQYAKTLSKEHTAFLLDKAKTPLQLNLLLLRLLNLRTADFESIQKMGGGIEAINSYLSQVISDSPTETDELIAAYLKLLLEENAQPNFVLYLLSILAYCEYGLQEDDIRALFDFNDIKWVELDYIRFLEQFGFFVRVRDNGRLDLSHDIIRQTLYDLFGDNKKIICSWISMYLLYREKQDVVTIRSFLNVTFESGQHKRFVEFVKKYKDAFLSIEPSSAVLVAEIRNGINRLFLKDEGNFLFASVGSCRSIEDIAYFQMILSSSLLSINDYHTEEIILKIAHAVMFIPRRFDFFPDNLFEMEMLSCERFLNRHNVSRSKTDEFLAFCKKAAMQKNQSSKPQKDAPNQTIDEMLDSLHNVSSGDKTDKTILWLKLAKTARAMAENEKTVHKAETLSLALLGVLQEGILIDDTVMKDILYADVYTTLGAVYKTLKEWENGIRYDRMSLVIYKKLYEKSPSADIFKKYRERVYNLANIIEAWAMHEKDNLELWEQTKAGYEDAYAMELMAISHGISERDILHSASPILSLGTALINLGRHDEGIEKYTEGIALIMNSAKINRNVDLYAELSIHLLECIYQLLICEKRQAAYELSSHISAYLSYVIESDNFELVDRISKICVAFSNQLNDVLRQLHDREDLEGQIIVSRILYKLYTTIMPIAPHEVKANIIIIKCNICAILFWQKKDYLQAYEEYNELLQYVVEQDLAAPDENGKYVDAANARLVDAYIRSLLCLERMDRQEDVKALVGEANKWAKFFADHIDALKGDAPRVLFEMSTSLTRNESPLGLLFLMKAFNAVSDDEYDKNAHMETVMMIVKALSNIKGEDGD